MSVKKHYDTHLGNFYEWMVGDFEEKQATQEAYFVSKGISSLGKQRAIDLGAGHGLQSISLANLGFEVSSIDFNQQLLESLRKRAQGYSIEVVDSDILTYLSLAEKADLILCMGDTLAHFQSFEELQKVIAKVYDLLNPGCLFISSFRDYQFELEGPLRFIPVKSDSSRILTCFLEYKGDRVVVTDLLYERNKESWVQEISSYEKLRIGVDQVQEMMTKTGFKVQSVDNIQRMNYLIVQK